jgi:hypothetical protein
MQRSLSYIGPCLLALTLVPEAFSQEARRQTAVAIRGEMFHINGKPTYPGRTWKGKKIEGLLLNSRMVQATFDDLNPDTVKLWAYPDTKQWDAERNTREFLAVMPMWRKHGLLGITLNLQGGSPQGYSQKQPWHNSTFKEDGSLRADYLGRLERVLDKADELGMVVILGLFYFGQDERLNDEDAVKRGVDNAIDWLFAKGYRHVLIEINNECNVRYDHEILKPNRVHELIERVKKRTKDGRRFLVGTSYGGGVIPKENIVRASDFLLLHANGVKDPARIAEMVQQTRKVPGYRAMPILFNEDDHFDFDQPRNNFVAAISEYASWGYFDYRMKGEGFDDGYQSMPVNWPALSARKQSFYRLLSEITKANIKEDERLRVIIETDAGGDPDDEQSLVRFLLYANEWDLEGIICTRPKARDKENLNQERTGLGIVRRQLKAYGECYPNLVRHDRRFPTMEYLWQRTIAGYDGDAGVKLILAAADSSDPRPVWLCNWGTDKGSAESSLKQALDRVHKERGPAGYAKFKSRFRLSSADRFGEHTFRDPAWPIWVDTFRPELEGKRWYHRFSALTAKAGGFHVKRDVLTGHGPLGALYPTNTGLSPQKEGDTMSFLYLVPTGMNDPLQPTWGSWGGRYGLNEKDAPRPHFWANQKDQWEGTTHRDNTLKRWAVHLQNDFRARLNWCVDGPKKANHPPRPHCQGDDSSKILYVDALAGKPLRLSAMGTADPDGARLDYRWYVYSEAGTYAGQARIADDTSQECTLHIPTDAAGQTIHVILEVTDYGEPRLTRYRRVVVAVK